MGNSLNTAHTCRLHKTYSGQKSKEHPDVLIAYTCGRQKSKEQTYMLITYTCGGQKSNGCAYTLVAYTCGGQKSNGCAYTLVTYTYGGQKSRRHAYTVIAYTCGGQKSNGCAYTLVAYTCGGQKSKVRAPELPRIPLYALGGPLTPVWGPNSLEIPHKRPKRPFFRLSCPITQPPGGRSKNRAIRRQGSSKSVNV